MTFFTDSGREPLFSSHPELDNLVSVSVFRAVLFQVSRFKAPCEDSLRERKGALVIYEAACYQGRGGLCPGLPQSSSLEEPIYTSAIVITLQSQHKSDGPSF